MPGAKLAMPGVRWPWVEEEVRRPKTDRVAGFLFRLETVDGAAADPPTVTVAVPDWPVGSQIYFRVRTLRVIGRRDDDADQAPVLIVEETAE